MISSRVQDSRHSPAQKSNISWKQFSSNTEFYQTKQLRNIFSQEHQKKKKKRKQNNCKRMEFENKIKWKKEEKIKKNKINKKRMKEWGKGESCL